VKDTQKLKLNDGEVVTAPTTQVDKRKKDRNIKSEYYELPAKHEDIWQSIKQMYGLDEVEPV
jgi:transcriptional antiterminator Rof (Rho-off)